MNDDRNHKETETRTIFILIFWVHSAISNDTQIKAQKKYDNNGGIATHNKILIDLIAIFFL